KFLFSLNLVVVGCGTSFDSECFVEFASDHFYTKACNWFCSSFCVVTLVRLVKPSSDGEGIPGIVASQLLQVPRA
ncbi:unnamed protein product, partial [Ixodes pacificus]